QDLIIDPHVIAGEIAHFDQLVTLVIVGQSTGVHVRSVGGYGDLTLASLLVVHDVPVVHTHGLGGGNGTDLNIDPAVVDGEIAHIDQLVTLGNVGQSTGVHDLSVAGYGALVLSSLLLLPDVR